MKTKTKTTMTESDDSKMLAKRSEILFCYDSRMSNPNGDPEENHPRVDDETHRLYVTEFRLKRTIRKYLNEVMGHNRPGHNILLRQEVDEELEKSEGKLTFKMLDKLAKTYIREVDNGKGKKDKIQKVKREELLNDHIDVKLFGILFAVKGGINFKTIGPVQFAMGQSLNTIRTDTDIMPIAMTSLVPNTKDEATGLSKGGSFGEKWIVRYAFIQHHGFINNNAAREVELTEADVKTMTYAMWNGTDALATTSKFGQKSRLMLKVNYKDNGYIGDLDLMTKLEYNNKEQTLENITQIRLNLDDLLEILDNNKDIIESIEYEFNPVLQCTYKDKHGDFEKLITEWSKQSKIPVERIQYNINDEMIEGAGEERIEETGSI